MSESGRAHAAVGALALILVITAIAFANLDPANLGEVSVPFLGEGGIDPTVIQLVFGVIIVSYFGHTSAAVVSVDLYGSMADGPTLEQKQAAKARLQAYCRNILGYTPDYVAGVWIGLDRRQTILRGASGGTLAAPVWGRLMRRVYEGLAPPEPWRARLPSFRAASSPARVWPTWPTNVSPRHGGGGHCRSSPSSGPSPSFR